MPRYDFECKSCGLVEEHLFSMSAKPDTVSCPCGGEAVSIITELAPAFVKGVAWEIPYHLRTNPIGWEKGNTDAEAQERRYAKLQQETSSRCAELARGAHKKNDFRIAAKIPRELFLARQRQCGKDYWQNEGDAALKRDGLMLPGGE